MSLVEISSKSHNVSLNIRYATEYNFTGAPVYGRQECYLHEEAEEYLIKAMSYAENLGYRFKIFDAFRPVEAQWLLWNHTPDPNFLADPQHGSPHSRGVAVDLTLIDKDGEELEMGTDFDAFTSKSHHGNLEVSNGAQFNRYLLLGIMTTAGWDFYQNEWWHYQLHNVEDYSLLSDSILEHSMMSMKT
mgnify:CR=1 FL=1